MLLKKLRVNNFRNIERTAFELNEGLNVFSGRNAQGKTNMLESMVSLADGRSFRGSRLGDLIRRGATEACVEGGVLSGDSLEHSLQVRFNASSREFMLNGKPVSDMRDYLGKICFVVFSAESMNIVSGTPQDRRDFLDHAIFALKPSYGIEIKHYRKILKERNALLLSASLDFRFAASLHGTAHKPWRQDCRSEDFICSIDAGACLRLLSQIRFRARIHGVGIRQRFLR